MELKQQVVSLELARKLKELGFNQESLFSYIKYMDEYCQDYNIEFSSKYNYRTVPEAFEMIPAYTVAELGEYLKTDDAYRITPHWYGGTQQCWGNISFNIKETTEADARAKMLIYLKENKLI